MQCLHYIIINTKSLKNNLKYKKTIDLYNDVFLTINNINHTIIYIINRHKACTTITSNIRLSKYIIVSLSSIINNTNLYHNNIGNRTAIQINSNRTPN